MNNQPPHQHHHNHTAPQHPSLPSLSPAQPLIFVNATDPASIARASLPPSSTPSLAHRPPPTKGEITNSLRREDYQVKRQQDTLWLNNAWGGSSWLPQDLRDGVRFQPAARVLVALIDITKWARQNNVELDSLWRQGGALREAVSGDFEERKRLRKPRSRPLKPYLTVPLAQAVLGSLRQSTSTSAPSAEDSSSYAPLLEPQDDDDDSFIDPDLDNPYFETPASPSASASATNMSAQNLDSRMDIELPAMPTQKRPSSPPSPSSTRVLKKIRKSDFSAADQIMQALSTNSGMRSNVMNILGRLLSVQPQPYAANLRWIEPVFIAADTLPSQLRALDFESPVAVAVFSQSPAEHWSLGILNKAGQNIQLRLHDCQSSDERSELIKQRFGEWMDVVANHAKVEVISETCPRLLGNNWSSGLHVLSCFRRALGCEPCSTTIPFVPATEQNSYFDLINRGTYASDALAIDDQYVLDAVQSRIHDRKLASKPMDVLNQERAKIQEELRAAEGQYATKNETLEEMMRGLRIQKEECHTEILKVRARAEQFERVYQRKLTLAIKQEKETANAQADQRLLELEAELAEATAAKEKRQAELEEAADQHDDNMVDTDDWKRYLAGAMGELFGDEAER